jgi:hypothetical protein
MIAGYTFTWHSQATACRECSSLNGTVFENQDIFQSRLYSIIWGDVWDLDADKPLTHGNTGKNCRCRIDVKVLWDWSELRKIVDLEKQ